jgi:hypothetical protein
MALERDGTVGDIYIFGGAAMVLAYQAREATRDVDALFEPREKVHQAALLVAEELGLPRWWLNDQATVYLPRTPDERARLVFDHSNLRVTVVSPTHLLAMKALAARSYADIDDITLLCDRLGVTKLSEVEAICARVYPNEPLSSRARIVVEDIVQQLERQRSIEKERSHDREGPGLTP